MTKTVSILTKFCFICFLFFPVFSRAEYLGLRPFLNTEADSPCPNLSGNFTCTESFGGVNHIAIKQDGRRFQLQGKFPLNDLTADGVRRSVSNGNYYRNASYLAHCQGDQVLAKVKGDVYQGSLFFGQATADIVLYLNSSGHLVSDVKGLLRGLFTQTPINEKLTCTRN